MRNARSARKMSFILVGLLAVMLVLSACGSNNGNNGGNNAGNAANETETTNNGGNDAAGAGNNEAPAGPQTVTDGMGHEVKIPAEPKKILASYLEDPVVTLGQTPVAQWSVANGIQDYLAPQLKDVPTIAYDLPVEKVLSYAPDLIIIGSESAVQKGLYEQYAKIAPTYVLGDKVNKDWREALKTIGALLGKSGEADKALQEYDQKAADAKAKLASVVNGKKAAALWLVAKNFYIVDETQASGAVLYKDLGLTPPNIVNEIPAASKAVWNPISLEKLATLDADYIFLVNSDKADAAETLKNPLWQGIPAVKNKQVFEIPSTSSWLYSGKIAGEQIMDEAVKFLTEAK
ncbi:ABC transporter substrate-binding protein [Paenibacillus sacheonensis]|uniref:ABC transporter substrate-binding protein n=1 Tax=Paenibacillus sacheonensis TaxID=742054 RepID=A0A7X4YR16_9BACL|nr:ABC transporter substrate-binding protein [Paenibacillus sacheonensis]MBM7565225.1 iron complex transport system substrate-binding protein [Paenibacillus sacheonensis]NBC69999.1 ABC transporter substrate-binding protein [Paenibacillus sacheonensis]